MSRQIKLIRVAVGIIVRHNKILICERPKDKPYAGYWEFPGGKIELNEESEAALKRELKEELGIEILSPTLLFHHEHAYPDKTVMLEIWKITEFLGEPFGLENQNFLWANFDELAQLKLLQGNVGIMERIKKILIN